MHISAIGMNNIGAFIKKDTKHTTPIMYKMGEKSKLDLSGVGQCQCLFLGC